MAIAGVGVARGTHPDHRRRFLTNSQVGVCDLLNRCAKDAKPFGEAVVLGDTAASHRGKRLGVCVRATCKILSVNGQPRN